MVHFAAVIIIGSRPIDGLQFGSMFVVTAFMRFYTEPTRPYPMNRFDERKW